jgi:hypothetical protein
MEFAYDVAPSETPDAVTFNNTRYSLSEVTSTLYITENTGIIGLVTGGEVTIHYSGKNTGCVYSILGLLESTAPVELSFFSGKLKEEDIELNWITDVEENNAGFEVQRSFDGDNFETITMVPGAGSVEGSTAYNFKDEAIRPRALNNLVYYRLKQIDFDGSFTYSSIISVDLDLEFQQFEITKITGWNSSDGIIKVYLQNYADTKKIKVLFAEISGKVIERRTLVPETGLNYLEFNLSSQQNNVFFISLNNGKTVISEKIVLNRSY